MPNLSSLVNPNSAVITNSASQPVPTTVSDATVALEEIAFYLGKLVKMSEALAVVDINQRQRVSIDAVVPTIVVNGNNSPFRPTDSSSQPVYATFSNSFNNYGVVPEVWRTIELARQNFQTSIRSNLQFT